MGRDEYNKVKSDENRTANVLICGSEAIEMPVFTQSLCNSTFPVIPTERKSKPLIISSLDFFYALNWRVFGVLVIVLAFLDS